MRIALFGDPHGSIRELEKIIRHEEKNGSLAAAICTGDMLQGSEDEPISGGYKEQGYFSVLEPPQVPFYFVRGNHENEEIIRALERNPGFVENFHLIRPGETYSVSEGADSIILAGMGGNLSPKIYSSVKKRADIDEDNEYRRYIVEEDVKKMLALANRKEKSNVLVFHEAPTYTGLEIEGRNVGLSIIDEIVSEINPLITINGHHHIPKITTMPQLPKQRPLRTTFVSLAYPWRSYAVLDVREGNYTVNQKPSSDAGISGWQYEFPLRRGRDM